jgi:creatinine amidohydrolase
MQGEKEPMQLELMTSPQVADYLRESRGIVIPVGATEQHGPDGLIGTDHLCAEAVARRFGRARSVIVAPTVSYGMSQFHLGFPGTISLRPSTLAALIQDLIASLAATGFRRIYLLNGHGGNIAPIRCGVQEFYAARSFGGVTEPAPVQCHVRSWWELPTVDRLRKSLYGAAEGYHVTPSEVAITMAAHPGSIAPFERAPPADGGPDMLVHAGDNYYDAADFRARFPDGRVISHAALATPAAGEDLLAAAASDLAVDFERFCAAA